MPEIRMFTGDMGSQEFKIRFLSQRIHVVCEAFNALTVFNALATSMGNLTDEEADSHCRTVNEKNEVGTLYPAMSLTLLPAGFRNAVAEHSEILTTQLHDCFKANELYHHCSEILFALDSRCLTSRILEEAASSYKGFRYTEAISVV